MAAMRVVSARGERWLPQTAPENMAPRTGKGRGMAEMAIGGMRVSRERSIWTPMGVSMMMVPQAEPVSIDIKTAVAKKRSGNRASGANCKNVVAK